ncbi:MAG: ATP phosphoribosyltransferase [Caulobacterales bacterium]|nr:ATP phosphoribosyltransferase [Caulobacterales bacterium]
MSETDAPLVIGLPSKGRLQEQCEAWLAECGIGLRRSGGDRGYSARLTGVTAAEVRLLSAREIAIGLDAGDLHLGVTGDDLLREVSEDPAGRLEFLRGLGFGRADLVVAIPHSWIDVTGMADLEDVAARERAERGRQLRVATKYPRQTRGFFARAGLADYRIVESHGATEGAPSGGIADVIVDITTTGRTLAANHLKVLADGIILKSEARLTASLSAPWPSAARSALKLLLDIIEARAAAAELMHVRGQAKAEHYADLARRFGCRIDPDGAGALCPRSRALEAGAALRDATGATVSVTPAGYVFEPKNPVFERFLARISG